MKNELLFVLEPEMAFLDNSLEIVKNIFNLAEFKEFLENSELNVPTVIKKGYPKKTTYQNVEVYINTSSYGDSLRYDTEDGTTEVALVVDVILPDNEISKIWKYQDAFRTWISQFIIGKELVEMTGRIYTKADGESVNHFTLVLDVLADILCDENPQLIQ